MITVRFTPLLFIIAFIALVALSGCVEEDIETQKNKIRCEVKGGTYDTSGVIDVCVFTELENCSFTKDEIQHFKDRNSACNALCISEGFESGEKYFSVYGFVCDCTGKDNGKQVCEEFCQGKYCWEECTIIIDSGFIDFPRCVVK